MPQSVGQFRLGAVPVSIRNRPVTESGIATRLEQQPAGRADAGDPPLVEVHEMTVGLRQRLSAQFAAGRVRAGGLGGGVRRADEPAQPRSAGGAAGPTQLGGHGRSSSVAASPVVAGHGTAAYGWGGRGWIRNSGPCPVAGLGSETIPSTSTSSISGAAASTARSIACRTVSSDDGQPWQLPVSRSRTTGAAT